jgi:hypothetical protein
MTDIMVCKQTWRIKKKLSFSPESADMCKVVSCSLPVNGRAACGLLPEIVLYL